MNIKHASDLWDDHSPRYDCKKCRYCVKIDSTPGADLVMCSIVGYWVGLIDKKRKCNFFKDRIPNFIKDWRKKLT